MSEETIIGLKTNCKKGFSLAEFWLNTYNKAHKNLLKSWKLIDDIDAIAPIAWDTVMAFTHYQTVESEDIGIMSVIKDMVIPEKTYKNKKGETKTKAEEHIPAHYTKDGQYLGRVSLLGEEPISYTIKLRITPTRFNFTNVGDTLESCFELKSKEEFEEGEIKTKDITKTQRKANKSA